MSANELSNRKRIILKAIVDAHIRGGEPVGSKYLTQLQQLSLSSATIRNEMSELEEMGYLEQPHTSAGRIPSESGYRFYVNSLMGGYRLTVAELRQLNSLLKTRISELDRLLERATKLISAMTDYTTLAVKPKPHTETVSSFKTVFLSPDSFLLIMITGADEIKTRRLHADFTLTEELLRRLETVLNVYVTGKTMDMITLPLIMELTSALPDCEMLINPVIKCVYEAINEQDEDQIKIEGMDLLLKYPEFSDTERIREMLGLMEYKDELLRLVKESERNRINIIIGSENRVGVMKNSTLIFRAVNSGDRLVGVIGVLGPCRMDYSRVISTVNYMANSISEMSSEPTKLPIAVTDSKKKT